MGKHDNDTWRIKQKAKSNLALIHGGNGQLRNGFEALRAMTPAMAKVEKSAKRQRRKRQRRLNTRDYLPNCEGEYFTREKTVKEFTFSARINPYPRIYDKENDTWVSTNPGNSFEISPLDFPPMTREAGFTAIKRRFINWCKNRDVDASRLKFSLVADTEDKSHLHFIASRA